jgi:hypothetical protein
MNPLLESPSSVRLATPPNPLPALAGNRAGAWVAVAICCAAATLLAVLTLTSGPFRDHEGFLTGSASFPVAAAAAAVLATLASIRGAGPAAPWIALAILGQGASLQLIDAGPWVHYERYRLVLPTTVVGRLAIAILLVQTLLVCTALLRRRTQIASLLKTIGVGRLVLCLVASALCAAAVAANVSAYVAELLLAAALQSINLATIVLFAAALPADVADRFRRRLAKWIAPASSDDGNDDVAPGFSFSRLLVIAAVWTTAISALLSILSYQRHPHLQDEVVYLHQARMLAAGTLSIPAPAVSGAFDFYLMDTKDGRWFATPPVGWPAVLAVGVFAGVPWLVNPVLGGIGVVLAGLLVRELYDRRIASLVVIILCASPWFLFINMSYMTHSLTLVCGLLAALGLLRASGKRALIWAVAGGAALGYLSLIRPLEGVILGTLLALRGIGLGGPRLRLAPLVAFSTATVLVGSIVFPFNHALAGSPTKFPINDYLDRTFGPNVNALGFGPGRGMGWGLDPYPGHSSVEAVINTNLNLFSLNRELTGWGTGSILLLAFGVLTLRGTSDRLMLATILAVVAVHAFYWYSGGPDFGARYWYLILIPCLVLTVRALDRLAERIHPSDHAGQRVWAAVGVLVAVSLMTFVPWRAIDKYHHYLGMRPDVPSLMASHGVVDGALVLIRGKEHPDYTSAATFNPLDWNSDQTLYAFDRSAETTAALLRAYPSRPVWVLNGPSITGRGYEVVARPQ